MAGRRAEESYCSKRWLVVAVIPSSLILYSLSCSSSDKEITSCAISSHQISVSSPVIEEYLVYLHSQSPKLQTTTNVHLT